MKRTYIEPQIKTRRVLPSRLLQASNVQITSQEEEVIDGGAAKQGSMSFD